VGSRVNNYSPSTADLTSVMGTLDATRIGYIALSLASILDQAAYVNVFAAVQGV